MAVYIRMALYFLAPLVAMVPGIEYISTKGVITIDLEVVAASLTLALTAVVGVFAKWGKK